MEPFFIIIVISNHKQKSIGVDCNFMYLGTSKYVGNYSSDSPYALIISFNGPPLRVDFL